jgi:uncharacterized damage-inducible protein DinB
MTVQEFQAQKIEGAAYWLAHFIATTPADKQDWTPTIEGSAKLRSMLDFANECVIVNNIFAQILRGETPTMTPNIFEAPRNFNNGEEAGEALKASAKACADSVRAMSDADLTRMYATRRGEFPGHVAIEFPYRNMTYHSGQANLYQLQYGDEAFHFPAPK